MPVKLRWLPASLAPPGRPPSCRGPTFRQLPLPPAAVCVLGLERNERGRGETRLERRGNEMTIEYIIEERRGTVRESMGPGGLST